MSSSLRATWRSSRRRIACTPSRRFSSPHWETDMLVVTALGGNALLRRGEPMTAENQRKNVKRAASALAALIDEGHSLVITHGNGPQVGLLALQSAASPGGAFPLDVLGAESAGMIGYMIEQELANLASH